MLGLALGKLESAAALGAALRAKPITELATSLASEESAITKAAALGLTRADYTLQRTADGRVRLTVTATGLPKLAKPIDQAEYAREEEAAAIQRGERNVEGWLPGGIVSHADLSKNEPPGMPSHYWSPGTDEFRVGPGDDAEAKVKDYIGARFAQGDNPEEIYSSLNNHSFLMQATGGDNPEQHQAITDAVDRLMPTHKMERGPDLPDGTQGPKVRKQVSLSEFRDDFTKIGREWAEGKHGTEAAALHGQTINTDDPAVHDAAFRALQEVPAARYAFLPSGQVKGDAVRGLRDWFYGNLAKGKAEDNPEVAAKAKELLAERIDEAVRAGKLDKDEPPEWLSSASGEQGGLFAAAAPAGEKQQNPEFAAWHAKRKQMEGEAKADAARSVGVTKANETAWEDYVSTHKSARKAYESIQDKIRGEFSERFHDVHGRATGRALRIGQDLVRHDDRHAAYSNERVRSAVSEARKDAQAAGQSHAGKGKGGGQFLRGPLQEKIEGILQEGKQAQQGQRTLFGPAPKSAGDEATRALRSRASLGERVDAQLGRMLPELGRNMSGGRGSKLRPDLKLTREQQVAIRLIEHQGKALINQGVGAGKSLTQIGAFAHLHEQGKVKRGVMAVPSSVQQQFGSEMLRFTGPKAFQWFARGGASAGERMAAYRNDSGNHMVVVTHEALRDDVLGMVRRSLGHADNKTALAALQEMPEEKRASVVKQSLAEHGIDWQYMVVDESHKISGRRGKDESGMQTVLDALAHPSVTQYGGFATGTPVKNDVSEAFDMLHKVRPDKFNDWSAFQRRYGPSVPGSAESLRRLMEPYAVAGKSPPKDVDVVRHQEPIPLHPDQAKEYKAVADAAVRAQRAAKRGKVDVEAMRVLVPDRFTGPASEHVAAARDAAKGGIGFARDRAFDRVINHSPAESNAKLQKLMTELPKHLAANEPTVVFAHNIAAQKLVMDELRQRGVPFAAITGDMDGAKRDEERLKFQPEMGEPKAHVIVCSDAAEAGINLQRGKHLYQFDIPPTSKTHEQRAGRVYRTGQTGTVHLHDLVSDTPHERHAMHRLKRKAALGQVFQDSLAHLDETGLAGYLHGASAIRRQGQELRQSDAGEIAASARDPMPAVGATKAPAAKEALN